MKERRVFPYALMIHVRNYWSNTKEILCWFPYLNLVVVFKFWFVSVKYKIEKFGVLFQWVRKEI
jgi:hypothetical protein